jgi:hypothetical protein
LSFIPSRAACRDDPADFTAERAGDRDFPTIDVPEDLIPDFAMTIGSTDEGVAVENAFHVLKVDLVNAQISRALILVPSERANTREQFLDCAIFRHSEAPRRPGCDTTCITEVRYDGFEAAVAAPHTGASLRPYFG